MPFGAALGCSCPRAAAAPPAAQELETRRVQNEQLAARLFMLGVRRFLRTRWHLLQLLLLGFMFSDVLMAASPALWQRTHFTRPMRAVFIVCSHRKLRDTSAAVVLTI